MSEKKFKVEVRPSDYRDREMDISITHNGHQWWTTRVSFDEWPEIVAAVDEYLNGKS